MRSVWLCSRNDVIGNVAVIIAASGVFVTESGWPDLVVAAIMAVLAISSSVQVIRQARAELRTWRRLELSASSNGRQAASEERVVSGAR
jgi:Co/Zn/Cd efflux system component